MRLNKYIAGCGVCSRRKADDLISAGEIIVNGVKVLELGTKVNPDEDKILYQGVPIFLSKEFEYYILYKPTGVISTCEDTHDRKTVLDIVKTDSRLYPVGRLDYESSGLLILTNDGELTNKITHPSYEIEKEYIATVKIGISKEDIKRLKTGVYIDGNKTSPAKIRIISEDKNAVKLSFIIHEGRNRQIRKMVEAVGSRVYELNRVRLGNLTLKGLKIGEYRRLTPEEIKYLKEI
jgi:23S rRNA pseudouridine2605 synthase